MNMHTYVAGSEGPCGDGYIGMKHMKGSGGRWL